MVLLVRLRVSERTVTFPPLVPRIPGQALEKPIKGVIQPLQTVLQNLGGDLPKFGQYFFSNGSSFFCAVLEVDLPLCR